MSELVAIAPSAGKGNGLFAKVDFAAGTEVLTISSPLVEVADDRHYLETCAYCFAWKPEGSFNSYYSSATPIQQCTGCKVVRYCSKACQRDDWRLVHKRECPVFKELPSVLPGSVRAITRLLLLRPSLPAATWTALMGMQDHTSHFQKLGNWEAIVSGARAAHLFSGTQLLETDVQRLYCIMLLNMLTLSTPTLDPIGMCFDPVAAIANHSCQPNAFVVFSGRSLHIRSLTDIPKDAEITIAYISTIDAWSTRQKELELRWHFTCACPVCAVGPYALTDVYICPACKYPTIPDDGTLLCPACNHKPQGFVRPKELDIGFLWRCGFLGPTRAPLPMLHEETMQMLLTAGNYKEALKHQLLLCSLVYPILYRQPHHPVRVAADFVLVALIMEVLHDPDNDLVRYNFDWAKVVWAGLQMVCAAVVGSHGEDSGFAKAVRGKRDEVRSDLTRAGFDWLDKPEKYQGEVKGLELLVDDFVKELKMKPEAEVKATLEMAEGDNFYKSPKLRETMGGRGY